MLLIEWLLPGLCGVLYAAGVCVLLPAAWGVTYRPKMMANTAAMAPPMNGPTTGTQA